MGIQIACSRGCGYPISVSDEALQEAVRHGTTLNFSHEVCPPDRKVQPKFRATITIERISAERSGADGNLAEGEHGSVDPDTNEYIYVTKIANVGSTVSAPTFEDAFEELTKAVNSQWNDVSKYRSIVDG